MPFAGLKGLGEDVGSLQLGINVVKAAVGLLNDLFNAANVNLVGTLDVPHLLREAGLGNNDGGLIVFTYFELKG